MTVQYIVCFQSCGIMSAHNGPYDVCLIWRILESTYQRQNRRRSYGVCGCLVYSLVLLSYDAAVYQFTTWRKPVLEDVDLVFVYTETGLWESLLQLERSLNCLEFKESNSGQPWCRNSLLLLLGCIACTMYVGVACCY